MSEGQSHAPEPNAAAWSTYIINSMGEFIRGRWIVRWVGLLYSVYFLVRPAYRQSFAVWTEFAVFYAAFLLLYFLVAELTGRRQTVAFVLFVLHAFLYPSCAENPAVQGGDVEGGERSSPKLNSVSAAARCTGG